MTTAFTMEFCWQSHFRELSMQINVSATFNDNAVVMGIAYFEQNQYSFTFEVQQIVSNTANVLLYAMQVGGYCKLLFYCFTNGER